jgi:hypothetical protein
VSLKEQLRDGPRDPFLVQPGDVVVVSGASAWGNVWTGLTQVLGLSRDLLNIVVLVDYLQTRGEE